MPGHSLTDSPEQWQWDKPPRITDPEEDETAKDKIQQDKARLQKAILTVHDYIRKINKGTSYFDTFLIIINVIVKW